MIRYTLHDVVLEHDPETGYTITRYSNDKWSGCGVVDGDHHHAERLGITPQRHRLVHEMLHHLVADELYGFRARPTEWGVIFRDAHHIPQEAGGMVKPDWSEAAREEWVVTAATYLLYGRPHEASALMHLSDPVGLVERARWLLEAADRLPEGLSVSHVPSDAPVAA